MKGFLPWQQYKNPWDAFAVVITGIAVMYVAIGSVITVAAELGSKTKK
ncbi:hypothetical protein [Phage f2b1]|nr:hypothetical protein [Phage f2b1]